MDYYERAKSAYNRRDVVRAAVILAEGLIRDPANDEGVGWLLRLYVEDLRGPGLERELLRVMEKQRNGHDLYRVVCAELRELEKFEKLEALQKVRRQLGLFTDLADNEAASLGSAGAATSAPSPAEPRDERRSDDDADDDDDRDGDDDEDDRDDDDDDDLGEDSDVRRVAAPASERWDRFRSPLNADEEHSPRTTTLRQRSRPLRAIEDEEESLYARGRSSRERDAQRKRALVIGGVLLIALVAIVLFALLSPPRGETPPMPFGNATPTPGLSNPGTPGSAPAVAPAAAPGEVPPQPPSEPPPQGDALPPAPMVSPPGDGAPADGSAAGSGAP